MPAHRTALLTLAFCATAILILPAHAVLGAQARLTAPVQELPQAEAVFPQERRELQLTVAPSFVRSAAGRILNYGLSAEYGLTDQWQLETGVQMLGPSTPVASRMAEPSAVSVGVRRSWIDVGGSGFHAAAGVAGEWTLRPTSDDAGGPAAELGVGMAYDVGARGLLFASAEQSLSVRRVRAGIGTPARVRETAAHLGGMMAFGTSHVTTELSWMEGSELENDEGRHLYLTPGFIKTLPAGWELTLGVPWRLGRGTAITSALAKLTVEF